ncbi:MAG: hypothetical protein IT236_14495 [Bacteroidia bacterium]|nr:hypothetical protein [Bacteroidia bacterium]
MSTPVSYKQVRELSGVFSATFGFIKRNFGTLYGSIYLFAGPFLLISSTISTVALKSFNALYAFRTYDSFSTSGMAFIFVVMALVMLIGGSVYQVIINKNIIDNENLPPGEKLSIRLIMSDFFKTYWPVLGNLLLFGLASLFILVFLGFLIAGIFTLFFGISTFFGVILIILFMGALFIFIPILCYVPMAATFVCQRDKINIFSAISKVFSYMKQNFWNTWAVSFLALITYTMLAGIVQLPVLIMNLIETFTRVKSNNGYTMAAQSPSDTVVILTVICSLLTFGVACIYHLMCIYQYGSLEEKREGTSVLEKISNIE